MKFTLVPLPKNSSSQYSDGFDYKTQFKEKVGIS